MVVGVAGFELGAGAGAWARQGISCSSRRHLSFSVLQPGSSRRHLSFSARFASLGVKNAGSRQKSRRDTEVGPKAGLFVLRSGRKRAFLCPLGPKAARCVHPLGPAAALFVVLRA